MAAWTGIKKGGQQMICPHCYNVYSPKKVLGDLLGEKWVSEETEKMLEV
jgi:hypothetical protein